MNDPLSGRILRTLEGLFELTRRPSRAFDSLRALPPELQRFRDTYKFAGALLDATNANLYCTFVEIALVFLVLKIGGNRPPDTPDQEKD